MLALRRLILGRRRSGPSLPLVPSPASRGILLPVNPNRILLTPCKKMWSFFLCKSFVGPLLLSGKTKSLQPHWLSWPYQTRRWPRSWNSAEFLFVFLFGLNSYERLDNVFFFFYEISINEHKQTPLCFFGQFFEIMNGYGVMGFQCAVRDFDLPVKFTFPLGWVNETA